MREHASPFGRAAAGYRKAVTSAPESVVTLDDAVMRCCNLVIEIDEAQQVLGIDRMAGLSVANALGQFLEVDPRAARTLQLLADCIEVVHRERARERLFDEPGD